MLDPVSYVIIHSLTRVPLQPASSWCLDQVWGKICLNAINMHEVRKQGLHRAEKARYRFPLTSRHRAKDSPQISLCGSLDFSPNALSAPLTPPYLSPSPTAPCLPCSPKGKQAREKKICGRWEDVVDSRRPRIERTCQCWTQTKKSFLKSQCSERRIALLSVSPLK